MVGGPKGSTSGAAGPWWGAERQQLLSCRTMVGGRKAAHPELQDHGGGASRRTEDGELVGQVADDGVLRKQEAQRHERERLQRVSQEAMGCFRRWQTRRAAASCMLHARAVLARGHAL
jgi:hypothetical protein